MKKKNFVEELITLGIGFALTFLVVIGMVMGIIVFGMVIALTYFWDKIH